MEVDTSAPTDNENPSSMNPIISNEAFVRTNPEPNLDEENNEAFEKPEDSLIQQQDEEDMKIFAKEDQQPEIEGTSVPRIQNKLFKPFKILRNFPHFRDEEEMSEKTSSSKVSKTHKQKLLGLSQYEYSSASKNKKCNSTRKPTFEEDNKENLPQSNSGLTTAELREKYKNLIYGEFGHDEEVECTICLETEGFSEDEIVLCDLCNTSFHQSCYGSELLKLEDTPPEWFCHRCSHLIKNGFEFDAVLCEFCPELKGAIKRIKQNSDKRWAHVCCVNWINEIWYLNDKEKTEVNIDEFWKNESSKRKSKTCMFCEIHYGDCIECDHSECKAAYHITCAQKRGLISQWKNMLTLKRENDDQ